MIESGHGSTAKLLGLCLSLRPCRKKRLWPSLYTINSFLALGTDEGDLGTNVEWEPCHLSQQEYDQALSIVMSGEPYEFDDQQISWEQWLKRSAVTNEA